VSLKKNAKKTRDATNTKRENPTHIGAAVCPVRVAPDRRVVAAGAGDVEAGDAAVERADVRVGVDVAGKADRGRRGALVGVGDEPEGRHHDAAPADRRLDDVRVGDRIQSPADGVGPDDGGSEPDRAADGDVPDVGLDDPDPDQISGQEHDEAGDRGQAHQDLHRLAVTARQHVRQREAALGALVVDLGGQQEAVEEQREGQSLPWGDEVRKTKETVSVRHKTCPSTDDSPTSGPVRQCTVRTMGITAPS